MCTVTIIPLSAKANLNTGPNAGVRVACNRDESRLRLKALPPVIREFGGCKAILPIDVESGGTWIAVNDRGLMLTLLNANPVPHVERSPRASRGEIIPALLSAASIDEAVERIRLLDPHRYSPFRLILATDQSWTHARPADGILEIGQIQSISEPLLFTSSGLGDELVEGPRRQLFDKAFVSSHNLVKTQDDYHRHRWPDQPHLSVCMSRDDARTVSHTIVLIQPEAISLSYYPDSPDIHTEPLALSLVREH